MGFYTQQSISNLTISQAIYEAALIIAVLRWIICLVFKIIKHTRTKPVEDQQQYSSCCQMLPLTSFGEIKERHPETEETCAVCLNKLKMEDEVRELMNCDHVFHKECIDKWLEHGHDNENHNQTCPLCRAPLINSYSLSSEISSCGFSPPQPSWAVERLLYLFGDDLLPC
ncbi:putative transcription factor C2H2 family [Medicago truncatula]|uniref:Anaphase-promoting complex subunit 11 RING-H2 finger protein n=1 Tax=Medicago truncatula TaxID=3880 RepID=G7JR49_MEDTR|nr:RING-H2 finger protein ATL64 [Medicago truncatula]AES92116.1 anaphase-promoting complex subunit 11 RING-H2 finger protein [Medicago truncatula]AFK46116.1 unknown [Medicago truncatula]RHN64500.1 putative transcription factor C2H2 family [Medicago truncatula]